jgi:hypothetical protein
MAGRGGNVEIAPSKFKEGWVSGANSDVDNESIDGKLKAGPIHVVAGSLNVQPSLAAEMISVAKASGI